MIGLELGIGVMGTILFTLHARTPRSTSDEAEGLDELTGISTSELRAEQDAALGEAVRLLRFGELPQPRVVVYKPLLLRHNGLSASRPRRTSD